MLFGSTPGLKNSQAASWLPRIAKEGLRGFFAATIADRLPLDQVPGSARLVHRRGGEERPRLDRALRRPDEFARMERAARRDQVPDAGRHPGGETVGSIKNYDVMIERIPDVQAITYEGMPHNICDADPDRCAADVLAFLRWRFGQPAC